MCNTFDKHARDPPTLVRRKMQLRCLNSMAAVKAFELTTNNEWQIRPMRNRPFCHAVFVQSLIMTDHYVHEVVFVKTLTTFELEDPANSGDVALV